MATINVHFRKWEDGDIIALWDDEGCFDVMSYMHIGQHGDAHYSLINELDKANREEYTPLLKELESIGYSVVVLD